MADTKRRILSQAQLDVLARARANIKPRSIEDRFWPKVEKTEDHWFWRGATDRLGYGFMHVRGAGSRLAHRISYEIHYGSIPEGLEIDHKCHTPSCVRPDHLRSVTRKQNLENRAGAQRNNRSSGMRGVSWFPDMGQWRVSLTHNSRKIHIGYFADLEEARAAAVEARNRFFTHNDLDRTVL